MCSGIRGCIILEYRFGLVRVSVLSYFFFLITYIISNTHTAPCAIGTKGRQGEPRGNVLGSTRLGVRLIGTKGNQGENRGKQTRAPRTGHGLDPTPATRATGRG
jgi:hypothetical protein